MKKYIILFVCLVFGTHSVFSQKEIDTLDFNLIRSHFVPLIKDMSVENSKPDLVFTLNIYKDSSQCYSLRIGYMRDILRYLMAKPFTHLCFVNETPILVNLEMPQHHIILSNVDLIDNDNSIMVEYLNSSEIYLDGEETWIASLQFNIIQEIVYFQDFNDLPKRFYINNNEKITLDNLEFKIDSLVKICRP